MSSTQGCYEATVHDAHEHQVNRRGRSITVWCPGKVRCAKCRKLVFRTTVEPLGSVTRGGSFPWKRGSGNGGWKCSPNCR